MLRLKGHCFERTTFFQNTIFLQGTAVAVEESFSKCRLKRGRAEVTPPSFLLSVSQSAGPEKRKEALLFAQERLEPLTSAHMNEIKVAERFSV